jgi:hypothetical protein
MNNENQKLFRFLPKLIIFLRKITLVATINDVQTFSYDIGDLTKKFNYWKFKSL